MQLDQKGVMADPNLQEGSKGPENFAGATSTTTWCNQATFKLAKQTGFNMGVLLGNQKAGDVRANDAKKYSRGS
jgi:hypothetical protein